MSEGGTDCQNKTGRAITDLEGVGQYLNRGGGTLNNVKTNKGGHS